MNAECRAARIARTLLFILENRKVRTQDVARKLGVQPRYVTQDLRLISTLLPFKPAFEGKKRFWCLDPSVGVEHLGILDRISLVLGQEVASFLKGTALHEGLARVDPEGLGAVEGRFARHLETKFRHHGEPARSYFEHRETMDDLLDALIRERRVRITYDRDGEARELGVFEPLTLVVYRRAVYLLCRYPEEIRPGGPVLRLAVDRIRQIVVEDPFAYPVDWNPDAELAPWFGVMADGQVGTVIVDFAPRVRRFVLARKWHPSQQISDLPDGGVRLRMQTGGRELVRWVLEWGCNCVVVEPPWLKEAVKEELKGAMELYASDT